MVRTGNLQVGNPNGNIDIVNVTLRTTVLIGNRSTVTVAYATPLDGNDVHGQFNGELHVIFNMMPGRPNRQNIVQF